MDESFDCRMMRRALELAHQGRITAPPNPWVGCVIAKDHKIIGEGYHRAAGEPHAEVMALQNCYCEPSGSTAYVTLEPCSHYGRTPPCIDALITSKIAKVFVGILDPDERVSGKGIHALRQAGIQVELGLCADKIASSLTPYLHHRKTKLPYCIAKAAVSLDGRISASDGSSKWISGEEAREDVQRLRAESQAIIIGSGTALKDHPCLTVRGNTIKPFKPPLRVVLDRSGNAEMEGPLFDPSLGPVLWITNKKNLQPVPGIEVINEPLALRELLQLLGNKGILQVLIEGGSSVFSSFLNDKLLNKLILYVGPKIIGSAGLPLFDNLSISNINSSINVSLESVKQFGESVRLEYTF